MNCSETTGCFYSFLDNTLEDSKLAELKEHLQKCTACAERAIAEKSLPIY
jgi:anti-sigma factor RsiW